MQQGANDVKLEATVDSFRFLLEWMDEKSTSSASRINKMLRHLSTSLKIVCANTVHNACLSTYVCLTDELLRKTQKIGHKLIPKLSRKNWNWWENYLLQ